MPDPLRPRRSQLGQASAEYVAVIAIVAIILAGATTAIAAPDIPKSVVRKIRTGICIVAGDVCDTADANAMGLEPCTTSSDEHSTEIGVTIAVFRIGGSKHWIVERRSDGSVALSRDKGGGASLTASTPGISLKTDKLQAGAQGELGIGFKAGKVWEMPRAQYDRLVARKPSDKDLGDYLADVLGDPSTHYYTGEAHAGVEVGVEAGGDKASAVALSQELGAGQALGWRSGPDGRTYYYEQAVSSKGELSKVIPALGRTGRLVAEWHASEPPVLTIRTSVAGEDRTNESVARLRLDQPGDREAARNFVMGKFSAAAGVVLQDDLARRIAARGSVTHLTYATKSDGDGWDVSVRDGLAVGIDHANEDTQQHLVGADVVVAGKRLERYDCLGLDAA